MKTLNAFALLFVLTALPVSAELVSDPETGLRTGAITVNGQTYEIGPNAFPRFANLSDADLRRANFDVSNLNGADLTNATLSDVLIAFAHFEGTNLQGSDLTGAWAMSRLSSSTLLLLRDYGKSSKEMFSGAS